MIPAPQDPQTVHQGPSSPPHNGPLDTLPPATPPETDPASAPERFDTAEAVTALSHYDLGVISAVQEFRRGSRRSPKLLIKCERGLFILKRLAPGRDDPARLAFAHEVQAILARAAFPLPTLIPTRTGETLLSLRGRRYELFECVRGEPYDQSPQATFEAGATLARFHTILERDRPTREPPRGGYHRMPAVCPDLAFIPHRLGDESLLPLTDRLREIYLQSADRADAAGLPTWPEQVIHGDWHPGNLLFRGQSIASVIDYDTARLQPRAIDLANAVLQFSLTRTGNDPRHWPHAPDGVRVKRLIQGYDSQASSALSTDELSALPWLMIEAMIAEAAIPIAVTGRFGRLDPVPILAMVENKVRWILANHSRIGRLPA